MTDIKKKDLSIGKIIVFIIAIALPVFHMWTASFGVYPSHVLSGIHWALVGSFIVVAKPLKGVVGKIIDAVLLLANVFICIYQIILQQQPPVFCQFLSECLCRINTRRFGRRHFQLEVNEQLHILFQ